VTPGSQQARVILRLPRRAALAAITALVAAASLVSFGESYRGLYAWARHHGLTGAWAVIWPLQVDVFMADRWPPRSRAAAWTVAVAGLAVSVAGNVGHVAGHALTDRITAAVPPLAAASALAVGLGVLKRVVAAHHAAAELALACPWPRPAPVLPAPATAPASGVPGAPALSASAPADRTRPALTRGAGNRAPGRTRTRAAAPPARTWATADESAEVHFAAVLADGQVPSRRRIKAELHVGQDRAAQIHDHLTAVATAPREHSGRTA
jgi:hypothetical protein